MLLRRDRAEQIARELGYFWLPCSLCGDPAAGFEWETAYDQQLDKRIGSIPVINEGSPGIAGMGVCSKPGCLYEAYLRNWFPAHFCKVDKKGNPYVDLVSL